MRLEGEADGRKSSRATACYRISRSKIKKKKKKKKEIKIEAQTIDFPPTFSTAFPLVELSAPCYYECVALAWRWAWQGTLLLSASTGKLKPPPLDAISHGSC